MTFAKPTAKPEEKEVYSSYCSVLGCPNLWAVQIDKPMCSFHQWSNTEKPRKPPILANYPRKVKTVSTWYDEVEF